MDLKSPWIPTWHWMDMFHGHLDCSNNHLLEVGLIQNRETMTLWMLTTRYFIMFYHVWGPAWIELHWNSIWLRAWSHMTWHYTWGSGTTLDDFGSVSGCLLDTFFWAHTISWSRLLARVWSGPLVGAWMWGLQHGNRNRN